MISLHDKLDLCHKITITPMHLTKQTITSILHTTNALCTLNLCETLRETVISFDNLCLLYIVQLILLSASVALLEIIPTKK